MTSRELGPRPPILVAFSPESARPDPVEFGMAFARLTGSRLMAIMVQRGGPLASWLPGPLDGWPGAARRLEHMRLVLWRRTLDVDVLVVHGRSAVDAINEAIAELGPELLVLGSTRRGRIGSASTGELAERVLDHASCPVALVPNGYRCPENGLQTIAVTSAARPAVEAQLREAVAAYAGDGDGDIDLAVDVIVHDDPARALVTASPDLDLLVMGSRERGNRLGNVSRQVADQAGCPILIIPPGATASRPSPLAHAAGHQAP
jgi:nucleotide-binding universal stress UspA family protein